MESEYQIIIFFLKMTGKSSLDCFLNPSLIFITEFVIVGKKYFMK